MKLDVVELTLRTNSNDNLTVIIDLFYREFKIYRPDYEESVHGRAIDADAIYDECWIVSENCAEADELYSMIYQIMDQEGKTLLAAFKPEVAKCE